MNSVDIIKVIAGFISLVIGVLFFSRTYQRRNTEKVFFTIRFFCISIVFVLLGAVVIYRTIFNYHTL